MKDTSKVMRFMTNNFLEAGVASITISSIADGFDFDDCLDPRQRTKYFRFGGRFLIEEDVNDKVYINASTFIIASDNYNTGGDLAQAITDAMGGVCSCLYDPFDKEFYFIQNGSAFLLGLANNTEAVWQTLGFSTGVNTDSDFTEKHAEAVRLHWPNEEILIDFGYQASVGFVGMITDLAEELKIPEGALIQLQGNTVNSFVAPPLDKTITWRKRGAFLFIDDIDDSSWRFMKITITAPTGNDHIQIGYLYMGDYSKLPLDRNISTGFEESFEEPTKFSESDAGQMYFNDKPPVRLYSGLQIENAKKSVVDFMKDIYFKKQTSTPFFVSLDPKTYLSTEMDDHLILGRFTRPPRPKHVLRDLYDIDFEIKEAL